VSFAGLIGSFLELGSPSAIDTVTASALAVSDGHSNSHGDLMMKSLHLAGVLALAFGLGACGNSTSSDPSVQALQRVRDARTEAEARRAKMTPLEYRNAVAQTSEAEAAIAALN
jgi:hypothetical protein